MYVQVRFHNIYAFWRRFTDGLGCMRFAVFATLYVYYPNASNKNVVQSYIFHVTRQHVFIRPSASIHTLVVGVLFPDIITRANATVETRLRIRTLCRRCQTFRFL